MRRSRAGAHRHDSRCGAHRNKHLATLSRRARAVFEFEVAANLPAREYWDEQWLQTLLLPLAHAGVEPYASRLEAKPDEIVSMFEAKDINVVVVGGETQGAWKILGVRHQATVSVDAWR